MLNIRQLRYFIAVVDAGNVSRAAAVLRVAQPALSLQISKLEKELGAALLIRSARGVQPTPAGDICYRSALVIVGELQRMQRMLQGGHDLSGEVSVGLTTSFSVAFAEPIRAAVRSRLPRVQIQIFDSPSHVLEENLLRGSLDLAVLHDAAADTGLRRHHLFNQRLCFVERAGAATTTTTTIGMANLVGRNLVLPTLPNATRIVVDRAFAAMGSEPAVVAEANSRSALLALVAGGAGNTILAWGGPPDPAFQWTLIREPEVYHNVSICAAYNALSGELIQEIQRIVKGVVSETIRRPDWVGAEDRTLA